MVEKEYVLWVGGTQTVGPLGANAQVAIRNGDIRRLISIEGDRAWLSGRDGLGLYGTVDIKNIVYHPSGEQVADPEQDKIDAERWRAFLNSERIRFFGTAGPHGDYAHFGGEFWTTVLPDYAHSDTTKENRKFLIAYADAARAAQSKKNDD